MSKKPKIIVGMSGGVDSSVCALLLKQQGYDVHGVFMKNWQSDDDDMHCTAEQDVADARAVCAKLDIPLHTVNFSNDYWDRVFTHFLNEYSAGRTPNPDILCNTEIKFKAFLDHAMSLGASAIATGHYVRRTSSDTSVELLKGLDNNKDQSYFLHGLNAQQLEKSLFPIGELNKPQVREFAKQHGFINHKKKDSTGICFIGERKFRTFLSEYLLAQPGDIEDHQGNLIGKHDGLMFYTIGQRQGLHIGGRKDALEAPWYVFAKDCENNILKVVQGKDHPLLFKTTVECEKIHWISGTPQTLPWSGKAKIRYRQPDQTCQIKQTDTGFIIHFDEPQRAVTPGQSIVFYEGETCLGGGIIVA